MAVFQRAAAQGCFVFRLTFERNCTPVRINTQRFCMILPHEKMTGNDGRGALTHAPLQPLHVHAYASGATLQLAVSPIGNAHCMHSARTLALNTVRRRVALPEQAPIRRATLHRWLSPHCLARDA
jgi:hypothetical protein